MGFRKRVKRVFVLYLSDSNLSSKQICQWKKYFCIRLRREFLLQVNLGVILSAMLSFVNLRKKKNMFHCQICYLLKSRAIVDMCSLFVHIIVHPFLFSCFTSPKFHLCFLFFVTTTDFNTHSVFKWSFHQALLLSLYYTCFTSISE